MVRLDKYKNLIFDCDGVLLNSNKIKTEAFYQAALPYGADLAQSLVAHHVANGGVSRYRKFSNFLDKIVPVGKIGPDLEELLGIYASRVNEGLMNCEVDSGIFSLRELTPSTPWFIVSGGDQAELRKVFAARKLDYLFDGGIFGSPDSKDLILKRELSAKRMNEPGLFIGDSRYDHQASQRAGLDFIFISHWTELDDWDAYCKEHKILSFDNLEDLT
jgi:phosphoglycolate phosphatase-like HAD superfamily hydrolase